MEDVELLKELIAEQKRTNDLIKETNDVLRQIYSFWSQIVSDEYFDEVLKNDLNRFPG